MQAMLPLQTSYFWFIYVRKYLEECTLVLVGIKI